MPNVYNVLCDSITAILLWLQNLKELCVRSWVLIGILCSRNHTSRIRFCAYFKGLIIYIVSHSVMSSSFNPVDCSPPGSSAHGILQARILEWVAIQFSIRQRINQCPLAFQASYQAEHNASRLSASKLPGSYSQHREASLTSANIEG